MAEAPHRVTFASGTVLDPEPVHLDPEPDDDMCGLPEAHIGLLLNHHTYKADIPVKHSLGLDVTAENPTYNLYIRVMALSETQEMDMADMDGDRFSNVITVKAKTIKEGDIREKIQIASNTDPSKKKEMVVTAKVLQTNQGNPVLKDGVHLVSHEHEDDSDWTEWPGHGRYADRSGGEMEEEEDEEQDMAKASP